MVRITFKYHLVLSHFYTNNLLLVPICQGWCIHTKCESGGGILHVFPTMVTRTVPSNSFSCKKVFMATCSVGSFKLQSWWQNTNPSWRRLLLWPSIKCSYSWSHFHSWWSWHQSSSVHHAPTQNSFSEAKQWKTFTQKFNSALQCKAERRATFSSRPTIKYLTLWLQTKKFDLICFFFLQETISELSNDLSKSFDYRFFATQVPISDEHQSAHRGSRLRGRFNAYPSWLTDIVMVFGL